MNKLLSAGFARLWKSTLFWLEVILMTLFFVLIMIADHQSARDYGVSYVLDVFFPGSFMFIGFFTAAFAAMFLGTEYSDGAIRNKLVMGHGRTAIYLSNLIVCFVSSVLVCLSSIVIICAMGIPMFGLLTRPLANTLAVVSTGILIVAAYSAVFTFIAMLISNKPVTVIVCAFVILTLYFGAMTIGMMLDAPEISPGYAWIEEGETVTSLPHPNPHYLRGTKRAVYEFLYDFLPTGQGFQIAAGEEGAIPSTKIQFPLYSLLITVSVTAGGVLAFCRKDLK
ncbi:MAG: ABC transporter permease [Lachnospiraceae bacterium]|nr:ABC transporter permease [Lachnospiraceae bacterium]MCM1239136.1 ABC transporter permease [Lachnospiraceae bacterium]